MNNLHKQPAKQLTALEILRQVERLEKQVAQLTVDSGRWRALAVAALRSWEDDNDPQLIMDQIRDELER